MASVAAAIATTSVLIAPGAAYADPSTGDSNQTIATTPAEQEAKNSLGGPRKDPIIITDNPYHDWECFRWGENCPK